MPLHLLGKKSWNVYNKENIAKVRRDEARARAEEEENERQRKADDANRRIQILRNGQSSPDSSTVTIPIETPIIHATEDKKQLDTRPRKRRRLAGENDTERDIRFAKEEAEDVEKRRHKALMRRPTNDAPIVDKTGHISLFPEDHARRKRSDKNPEAEAEAEKKAREFKDQYTMRFSNAAGFNRQLAAPWYSSSTTDLMAQSTGIPSKDVWGNEDPRRQEREKKRLGTNDPLAAIKKGVRQLRDVERERKAWQKEREKELRALKLEEKQLRCRDRHHHHDRHERRERDTHRRRREESVDSLENFQLDADPDANQNQLGRHRHREHRKEENLSRSRKSRDRISKNSDNISRLNRSEASVSRQHRSSRHAEI
ncbi:hypothetical protein FQN57_006203 [Myotisia sp. PD_48]|nr:hypothetical protein FQN57_006203 [Myotisia sp. PD_48]